MHGTGHAVLDSAVVVKLTRTLFIIPMVLALSILVAKKESGENPTGKSIKRAFPKFIILFLLISLITTILTSVLSGDTLAFAENTFGSLKTMSSFLIVTAMAAIGLNTDVVKLVRTGGKALIIGVACWIGIICMSLLTQTILGIW